MEPRYIERLLHGKRWDKNRYRTFLPVIEKTRYIETRYRELRLYTVFTNVNKSIKKLKGGLFEVCSQKNLKLLISQ
jgi:hypothetical protein